MLVFRKKTLEFSVIWGGDTPIDITGHTVRLQARAPDGRLMLDLSTDNGGVVVDGPAGRMTFTAGAEATAAVDASGLYEIVMETPDGRVYRVMSGTVQPVEAVVA
jgi:hypothetical protein